MAAIIELTSVDQWEQVKQQTADKPLLLFKHSTSCPVSAEAHDQFEQFLAKTVGDCAYARVLVIESRPVSNRIAEDLGIKHESPQTMLVKDGKVVWHTSHWRITADVLEEVTSGA